MNDKKNIDRLFQEKFKDFEVEPNEQIWVNIDAALREKKKRRIIPFWLQLSGVAAGLALGFFTLDTWFDDSIPVEQNPIVIGNERGTENQNATENNSQSVVNTGKQSEKRNTEEEGNGSSSIRQEADTHNKAADHNTSVASQDRASGKNAKKKNIHTSPEEENAITNVSHSTRKASLKNKKRGNLHSITTQDTDNAVAHTHPTASKKGKASGYSKNNNGLTSLEKNKEIAAEDQKKSRKDNLGSTSERDVFNTKKSDSEIAIHQKSSDKKNTSTLEDNLRSADSAEKKDSTAVAAVEPNALEELLKKNEKEKNVIAEAKMNRWQITSNVAPIYFSSTSNGSPIDDQFAENSKSYENNLSFGVGVNYAINKKLSVRTGVNKFTLGYTTNDVVFFAALDQASFTNIASSSTGSTIQVISQNNTEALRPFDSDIQSVNQGSMTQRMGYFEVPVEMSYKLIDNKFGINLIGGLSTLFLNENNVSVASSTMSANLGKANNLNDVHFSTNVGIGFKYRFWKSFEANFEPMFKYQINTFNKDAGNFKPYFIGLYSGVSFNF